MVLDALRLALGTLTTLRVRAPRSVDRRVAGLAMTLAPLAALPLAAVAGLVAWAGARSGLPDLVLGALAVGVVAYLSRGLHLDGLADTADGLAASYDRERSLEVMRRSDIGPAGVVTLVVVLLVQASAAGALAPQAVAACVLVSRSVLALACHRSVPAARDDGLGAGVAASVGTAGVLASVPLTTGVAAALLLTVDSDVVSSLLTAVATVFAAVVACVLVLARTRRRFGGVTGDVLGACVELSLAAALVTAAAFVP